MQLQGLRRKCQQLLLDERLTDWTEGWQLVASAGPPIIPLLWRLWDENGASPRRRCVLLAAIALAGGEAAAASLERVAGATTGRAERLMALTLLALMPDRSAGAPRFWERVVRSDDPEVVKVAALLAAARIPDTPGRVPPFAQLVRGADAGDPGLLAAAAAAGAPGVARSVAAWWQAADEEHAPLVWRGRLLGTFRGGNRGQPGTPSIAEDVVRGSLDMLGDGSDVLREARRSAALALAVAGILRPERAAELASRVPEAPHVAELAPEFGVSVPMLGSLPKAWVSLQPSGLLSDRQLVACMAARSMAVGEVLATSKGWVGDEELGDVLCWQIAARIAAQPLPVEAGLAESVARLPRGDGPDWIRWTAGQLPAASPVDSTSRGDAGPSSQEKDAASSDPLERAWGLALAGRLPRNVAVQVLEARLWQLRLHPEWVVERSRRALVRDLLLAGSRVARARLPGVGTGSAYQARGLPAEESAFQPVGVAVYLHLQGAPGPLPVQRIGLR